MPRLHQNAAVHRLPRCDQAARRRAGPAAVELSGARDAAGAAPGGSERGRRGRTLMERGVVAK